MLFDLMHQNFLVANVDIQISNANMYVELKEIKNTELLPLCLNSKIITFSEWFKNRCFSNMYYKYNDISGWMIGARKGNIPSRIYGYQCVLSLLSYSASLQDKYWLNPSEQYYINLDYFEPNAIENIVIKPSSYKSVDYFANPAISEDVGELLLYVKHPKNGKIESYRTPEFTTKGIIPKRWKYENNKFNLHKKLYKEQKDFIRIITDINSDIIPKYQIYTDKYGTEIIQTQCLTSRYTELISAVEIMLAYPAKGSIDSLYNLLETNYKTIGYSHTIWDKFNEIFKRYNNCVKIQEPEYSNIVFVKNEITQDVEDVYFVSTI